MRILYVMQYFPVYGGGETITVSLAKEFIKRGHEVHIAYTIDKTVTPMPYDVPTEIIKHKLGNLSYPFSLTDLNNLKRCVVDNKIDIVINQWADKQLCHYAVQDTQAKLIKCFHVSTFFPEFPDKGIKYVVSKLCPPLWNWHVHRKQLKNHIANYHLCDKYVMLTEYAVEELYREFKFDRKKVDYVYNPLTYSDYIAPERIADKKHQVLFVGRQIESYKRMSYFLKAWQLLAKQHDIGDWSLVILGEGPDKEQVTKTIQDGKIPNCVQVGFKAPIDYYRESALLLLTSYLEGFGMVIPEGMQNGVVPIVTDSFSAVHAIVQNEHDGLIVEDNNVQKFADAIWRMISNKDLREQMARNAIEGSKKFDIQAIADKWENIFKDLK